MWNLEKDRDLRRVSWDIRDWQLQVNIRFEGSDVIIEASINQNTSIVITYLVRQFVFIRD